MAGICRRGEGRHSMRREAGWPGVHGHARVWRQEDGGPWAGNVPSTMRASG
jgi:hypothetical protein